MIQIHVAIPLSITCEEDLAALEVLAASWARLRSAVALEEVGGTVSVTRRRQWLMLGVCGPSAWTNRVIAVIRDAVTARYDADGVRAAAGRCVRQAARQGVTPAAQASQELWTVLYGHAPAVLKPSADVAALRSIAVSDVQRAHNYNIQPQGAHMVIVGDLDVNEVRDAMARELACWNDILHVHGGSGCVLPEPRHTGSVRYIEKAGWKQSYLRLAAPSGDRTRLREFAARVVGVNILGGNFSSRINTLIREELGIAYRTQAALTDHLDRELVVFDIDVRSSAAMLALDSLYKLIDSFVAYGPTEDEVRNAAGFSAGTYELALGGQGSRASCFMSYLITGLPVSAVSELPGLVSSVTPSDVVGALSGLTVENMYGVVCGDSDSARTRRGPHGYLSLAGKDAYS